MFTGPAVVVPLGRAGGRCPGCVNHAPSMEQVISTKLHQQEILIAQLNHKKIQLSKYFILVKFICKGNLGTVD